ncbi:MAG: hypothetical protein GXX99_07615 [Clostridiales bacterium]|nr:hypothetical protein [Clostridiales bacterium]
MITTSDAETIDPTFGSATVTWNYLLQVFEPLIYRDENMELVGVLAESWEWIDELTFRVHLRPGVKFHSGADFNAESVRVSFERMFTTNTTNRTPKDIPFDGLEIIDSLTVDIKIKTPTPMLPYYLRVLYMLDPTVYEGEMEPILDPARISGTGPYRIIEWVRDDHYYLEAFEGYWEGAPSIKKVIYRPVPESSTRVAEMLAGNADIIQNVPIDQIDKINTDSTKILQAPGGRDNMIAISCNQKPFDDVRIRQAINYAVDKEAINDSLLAGMGEIYGGIVMPPNDNPDVKPYPYDPDKAKALLKEAGYETGLSVTIQTTTGRYVKEKEISQAVASYLQEVGINASVEPIEFSVLQDLKQKGTVKEMAYLALGGFFDGQGELNWANSNIAQNGWEDEEFIAKYAELTRTADPEKRTELINELQVIVHEKAPWLFLWRQPLLYGVKNDVEFVARRDENWELKTASFK